MRLLVTGSSGLVGSAVVEHFCGLGWTVYGIDNDQRSVFFGADGSTRPNQERLEADCSRFEHIELDIRDRAGVADLITRLEPHAVVHAAAQPSHDLAARMPFADFDTNAGGTLNLLEGLRASGLPAPFVLLSTNKVYGTRPNERPLEEHETRWEFSHAADRGGIKEDLGVDRTMHSLFGVSKLAADLLTQEYGKYFGIKTCCLRGGCLTGPAHAGVELHGFLSYLVRCNLERRVYTVFGYKGKQVRDNLHSLDVARFIEAYLRAPTLGEVYNLGGGRKNSCSLLEAFTLVEGITGIRQRHSYLDEPRVGDHICYYSDLTKARAHYPDWSVTVDLEQTVRQVVDGWEHRLSLSGL